MSAKRQLPSLYKRVEESSFGSSIESIEAKIGKAPSIQLIRNRESSSLNSLKKIKIGQSGDSYKNNSRCQHSGLVNMSRKFFSGSKELSGSED